jgi:molybdopterin synthase sulfur carrier subunit
MVIVEFLGPIALAPLEIEAETLGDVAKVLQANSLLEPWLGKCAVAVNDNMVKDMNYALKDGDRISLLPPVCGG